MQAAMRSALRGGFAAMTVRQIAREARWPPGSCTTTSPPSAS